MISKDRLIKNYIKNIFIQIKFNLYKNIDIFIMLELSFYFFSYFFELFFGL